MMEMTPTANEFLMYNVPKIANVYGKIKNAIIRIVFISGFVELLLVE